MIKLQYNNALDVLLISKLKPHILADMGLVHDVLNSKKFFLKIYNLGVWYSVNYDKPSEDNYLMKDICISLYGTGDIGLHIFLKGNLMNESVSEIRRYYPDTDTTIIKQLNRENLWNLLEEFFKDCDDKYELKVVAEAQLLGYKLVKEQ